MIILVLFAVITPLAYGGGGPQEILLPSPIFLAIEPEHSKYSSYQAKKRRTNTPSVCMIGKGMAQTYRSNGFSCKRGDHRHRFGLSRFGQSDIGPARQITKINHVPYLVLGYFKLTRLLEDYWGRDSRIYCVFIARLCSRHSNFAAIDRISH